MARYQVDPTCGVIPYRFYTCILAFLGLTICYIMRFCLSICITMMVKKIETKTDPHGCSTLSPQTSPDPRKEENLLDWSEEDQGMVLSSFFWGYVVTMIPAGVITDRLGARTVAALSTFLTAVCCVLTPVATVEQGMYGCIALRILLGLVQGCFYASLHTVVACWVPTEERGVWGTLVFTGAHFGNFLQSMCSGYMLHNFDPHWEYVFYIWGLIGAAWALLFFFTTWDNYTQVPNIQEPELTILQQYYEKVSKKKKVERTPWKDILTSMPVWAVIVGLIGHDWGLFALVVDLPKFINSVVKLDVKKNGLFVGVGYLVLCVVAYFCGLLVDLIHKKEWISVTWNRIIFTTIASVGPSVGLVLTAYTACYVEVTLTCLIIGMCTMGAFYPSLKVNPIDLSPNHAGVIGALGHCIGALSGIAVPYIIGIMTPDSSWKQWTNVWWVTFAVMSVTNIFYAIFASAETQEWNTKGLKESE